MGFWIYMPQLVAFFLMCDTLSLLNVPRALNQKKRCVPNLYYDSSSGDA